MIWLDVSMACVFGAPLAVVVASWLRVETARLRTVAVAAGAVMLVATIVAVALFALGETAVLSLTHVDSALAPLWRLAGVRDLLRVDQLSAALLPLPSALWLATTAVMPRSRLDRAGLPRMALATLATTLAFLTTHTLLLFALWTVSTASFLSSLAPAETAAARRVAAVYLITATLLFGAGVIVVTFVASPGGDLERVGLWLIVAAVLIRKGIFPVHAWVPDVFERGRLGPAVLFSAPQMGSYVAAVIVVPRASPEMLRVIAFLALVTAVYGAALALFQRDARRACGYLFISQSALVLAGLEATSAPAVAGALVLWLSSAFAFTGVARCVLVLEARRGRLDLTHYHGGYEQMPLLAASFLALGLACTGFPGTLGFAGEELLVGAAVSAHPLMGLAVVIASALTGLSVLRMYYSLFCGRRRGGVRMPLLRREAIVFGALAALLVVTGLAPGRLVASRLAAGAQLVQARVERRAAARSRRLPARLRP